MAFHHPILSFLTLVAKRGIETVFPNLLWVMRKVMILRIFLHIYMLKYCEGNEV